MIVFKQMLVFLIMIILGMLARKTNILTAENQGQFSAMVIKISCPALILSSAMSAEERMEFSTLKEVLLVLLLLTVLILVVSKVLPILMRYPKKDYGIVNIMGWCTNITFIGLPLVQGLYGSQATIYVTFAIMIINVLFYSYGVVLVSRGAETSQNFSFKQLINPGMIACVLACILYFAQIHLPAVITTACSMVGSMTAPLAMMMIGYGLMDITIREIFHDKKMLLFVLMKMIAIPVILLLVIKQLTINTFLIATCMAVVASPTGGMVSMLATLYNKDAYLMVTKEISITSLLSVITIPIVAEIIGI